MKKIMVVDDEPDTIYTIKKCLEAQGNKYVVISAKSGSECFNLLTNDELPDLILLDIMIPDMSGWNVYYSLKKIPKWKDIAIIFISARADNEAKVASEFLGEGYIQKPFEIEDLTMRIDKVLNKKKINND